MADKDQEAIRFAWAQGQTREEMRRNVHNTALYRHGDAVLVWVNRGDLTLGKSLNLTDPAP